MAAPSALKWIDWGARSALVPRVSSGTELQLLRVITGSPCSGFLLFPSHVSSPLPVFPRTTSQYTAYAWLPDLGSTSWGHKLNSNTVQSPGHILLGLCLAEAHSKERKLQWLKANSRCWCDGSPIGQKNKPTSKLPPSPSAWRRKEAPFLQKPLCMHDDVNSDQTRMQY